MWQPCSGMRWNPSGNKPAPRRHHSADVDSLRERFADFVESNDKIIDKDGARVLVVDHDATGMLVGFYATAEEPLTAWSLECELREAMLKAVSELERERSGGLQFLPAERDSRVSDFAGHRHAKPDGADLSPHDTKSR